MQSIKNNKSTSTLIEPGIFVNEFNPGVEVDENDLLEAKRSNMEMAQGKRYAVLVAFGYLAEMQKGAREKAASSGFKDNTIALALLAKSLGQKITGNFYMKINEPAVKTRLFTDRQEAINWLREQLTHNNILAEDWK